MLFDKLCKIVERNFEDYIPLLRQAKIFNFVDSDVVLDSLNLSEDEWEWASENMHLPFKTIAVEDKDGVIVYSDESKGQAGLEVSRKYILLTKDGSFDDHDPLYRCSIGNIDRVEVGHDSNGILNLNAEGEVTTYFTKTKGNKHLEFREALEWGEKKKIQIKEGFDDIDINKEVTEEEERVLGFASLYIGGMFSLNNPKRFVLEMAPKKRRKPSKKILRSADRPRYTVITPQQIRSITKWKQDKGEHNSPVPHERRGHWRTYRSDRYVNLKDQRRWIDDIWVGQSKGKVGNKFYQVLFGKPPYDK